MAAIREREVADRARAHQQNTSRRSSIKDTRITSVPRRRSERVRGNPPAEGQQLENVNPQDNRLLQANVTEETYTMEHVKALGSSNRPWILFVDGYDGDGNRIYDKVNGQTCHQCRQKTLGKRTACSECASLNGVFCGDCLYMRYGENIEEVAENSKWICPPCRDLCNCSFHRTRRGWAPTGSLYRHVIAESYSSVAHFLVLNNLEPNAREFALSFMPPSLAEEVREELKAESERLQDAVGKELIPSKA